MMWVSLLCSWIVLLGVSPPPSSYSVVKTCTQSETLGCCSAHLVFLTIVSILCSLLLPGCTSLLGRTSTRSDSALGECLRFLDWHYDRCASIWPAPPRYSNHTILTNTWILFYCLHVFFSSWNDGCATRCCRCNA